MNLTRQSINQYINSKADLKIIKRGTNLYENSAVKKLIQNKNKKTIIAQVQGGRLYNVIIKHKDFLRTSCDCPYDWGGICKHQIAALLTIKNSKKFLSKNNQPSNKITKHISSDWFEIPNYQTITIDEIKNSLCSDIYFIQYDENRHKIDKIHKNSIKIHVFDYWRSPKLVTFRKQNNKLESKCNCRTTNIGLCEHQASALSHIITEFGNNIFKMIDEDFIEKLQAKTLKEYGITKKINFYEWFEIRYTDKIIVNPVLKGKGLVKIDKNKTDNIFSILKSKQTERLSIQANKNVKKLELGFVLLPINNNFFEIIPIAGKPDKNKEKLSTHIATLNLIKNDNTINITDNDQILINELKKITPENIKKNFQNKYNIKLDLHTENFSENDIYHLLKYYIEIINKIKPHLIEKNYCYKTNERFIKRSNIFKKEIAKITPKLIFNVTENKSFVEMQPALKIEDKIIIINEIKVLHKLIFEHDNKIYFLDSPKDAIIIDELIESNGRKIVENEFDNFFDNYIIPVSKHYPIKFNLPKFTITQKNMKAKQKRIYISELENFVIFKPVIAYKEELINILENKGDIISKNKKTIEIAKRDTQFEQELYDFIKNLHPKFNKQFPESFFHLNFDEMIKDFWFFDAFEKFKENDIEVFGIKDLKKFKYSPHKANVSLSVSSGQDWFDVNVQVKFGDTSVALKDIRKAVIHQNRYIKLNDGTMGILPKEWIEKFERYFRQGEIKKDKLKISKLNFSIIDELFEEQDYAEIIQELVEKRKKLKEFTKIKKFRTPTNFKGKLRDYQKSGYNWLNFLDEFKWGGILADDMGLGKTIQILAFLLKQIKKSKKTNLIVVPTTLLFNWENEIEKFTPSINTYFQHGTNRSQTNENFKDYNLIITTYGTMTRDIELLRKYNFNYVILDESQAIKNPNSKRFKASSLLRANNKLALTGTPIQNNTFDLYAQMTFINPGFLGSQKNFKEYYSDPIDKEQNPIVAAELQRKITPFVLRRTKEQVATELPPKIEDYIYCEMEAEQRKVYDAFKNKYRKMLLDKIKTEGLGKSKIYILEGLTKLRQICDTPEILPEKENYGTNSIKIKELIRHINEKTGNHKILIFSQFVKMLSVIRRKLEAENIKYEYLDGKSSKKKRQESVNNFQDNTNIRVFLISLKAGGLGLNLTAADYVYIIDPWWNPAVENQAIDRCYRIGQDKKVIAYRMICKETIEEKIMKLQSKKSKIASEIITTDESFVKKLKKEDIENLFN